MPLPPAYEALRLTAPVSSSKSGEPATVTFLLNATVMLITEPAPYVPSSSGEVTDRTLGIVPSTAMSAEAASEPGAPCAGSSRSTSFPRSSATAPNVTSAPVCA